MLIAMTKIEYIFLLTLILIIGNLNKKVTKKVTVKTISVTFFMTFFRCL